MLSNGKQANKKKSSMLLSLTFACNKCEDRSIKKMYLEKILAITKCK